MCATDADQPMQVHHNVHAVHCHTATQPGGADDVRVNLPQRCTIAFARTAARVVPVLRANGS
jgi:hypothetical protein